MLPPDWTIICQIKLHSIGFDDSNTLARKLVELHQLCQSQLSHQYHYDFTGRSLKMILVESRQMKHRKSSVLPIECIGRAILAIHLPKIVDEDMPKFQSIFERLFPIAVVEEHMLPFKRRIQDVLEKLLLQPNSYIVDKIVEVYNMLSMRNGIIIVGDSMSGKTTVWQTLAETLKDLRANPVNSIVEYEVTYRVINPKAITIGQLFGEMDASNGDWCDGVLGKTFREMVSIAISAKSRSWIVLDGPVDVSWIERIHTLLDDNRKLSLTSGEMIENMPLMSILFETEHLMYASPTTVARCGIVHMNPTRLSWRILHTTFVAEMRASGMQDIYVALYEGLVAWLVPGLLTILVECQMILNITEMQQYKVSGDHVHCVLIFISIFAFRFSPHSSSIPCATKRN